MLNIFIEECVIMESVSFITARDPSIHNYNRGSLMKRRLNLQALLNNISDARATLPEEEEEEPEKEEKCIEVYLRVKPSSSAQRANFNIQGNVFEFAAPEQAGPSRNAKEKDSTYKKFFFSEIFGPDSKQSEVFDNVVKSRILEFINGENTSLFTYGASGAGKTFTIVGNSQEPGLIPRALEYLFRTLPSLPSVPQVKPLPTGEVVRLKRHEQNKERDVRKSILAAQKENIRAQNIKTYRDMQVRLSREPVALLETTEEVSLGVWVSFAEIYNEEIYDLLQTPQSNPKPRLRIGCANGNVYIKGLTQINVSNGLQAYQVFQHGIQQLKYAKTSVNDRSSRSHSVFTIKLAQAADNANGVHVSDFNFCDLAGIERSKKTLNIGERLKESKSINTSLMVLGRCISGLRHTQKHPNSNQLIPFRESKLTQLFQRAFTGHEDLTMIVNINTSVEMLDETLQALNFSAMASEITQSQVKAKKVPGNDILDSLHEEKKKLQQTLEEVKTPYKNLVDKRQYNLEIEERNIVEGWEQILQERKENHERKIEALIRMSEAQLQCDLTKVKIYFTEKLERGKRRKIAKEELEKNSKEFLEAEVAKKRSTLLDLEKRIHTLREDLRKADEPDLLSKLENNNKRIVELEKKIKEAEAKKKIKEMEEEVEEMDSFIKNEADCKKEEI